MGSFGIRNHYVKMTLRVLDTVGKRDCRKKEGANNFQGRVRTTVSEANVEIRCPRMSALSDWEATLGRCWTRRIFGVSRYQGLGQGACDESVNPKNKIRSLEIVGERNVDVALLWVCS
jgi:hypothetical protein